MRKSELADTSSWPGLNAWLSESERTAPISTNQPSTGLPFQRWFKFKEAFAPQLVLDVFTRAQRHGPVRRCVDPFGGCGTTGLTSQFVNIHPILVEVNPFIADLAEAKLSSYDLTALRRDFLIIRERCGRDQHEHLELLENAPSTLCEPGNGERWVFPKKVLAKLLQYRVAIEALPDIVNGRLLRVLLASVVVGVSNVTVNGKGRKYRGGWEQRQKSASDVDQAFRRAFLEAISDIAEHGRRPHAGYDIHRGSCLRELDAVRDCDLALFSPPYPNSFDYTDIYNLELWVLGYLKNKSDNHVLRASTLRSHVQGSGKPTYDLAASKSLHSVLNQLAEKRTELWDDRIPAMVGAYFEDMQTLLIGLQSALVPGGRVAIVIGDSSYASVRVPAAHITAEIARSLGFTVDRHTKLRAMRLSAQQGGEEHLEERLVELVH